MSSGKRMDLTTGSPIRQILLFSLPLVLGSLFWVNGTMFALRNTLTGMGYSAYSVFSGICELAGKCIGAFVTVKWFGFWGICAATPLAWFLAMLYCGFWVHRFLRQRLKATPAST